MAKEHHQAAGDVHDHSWHVAFLRIVTLICLDGRDVAQSTQGLQLQLLLLSQRAQAHSVVASHSSHSTHTHDGRSRLLGRFGSKNETRDSQITAKA